jgi:hypothetical protein
MGRHRKHMLRVYDHLKEDITDESYRQRFWTEKLGKDENWWLDSMIWRPSGSCQRGHVKRSWIIILEQFLKTLSDDVCAFVRKRNLGTSTEVAKLADDYLQARKEDLRSQQGCEW